MLNHKFLPTQEVNKAAAASLEQYGRCCRESPQLSYGSYISHIIVLMTVPLLKLFELYIVILYT